jgi:hypothetical protein
MKTCTVCKITKDENEFYYDSATERYTAKCCSCTSKFVAMSRHYKRVGKKLTTKEFRDNKLYLQEVRKYTWRKVGSL